MVGAVFCILLLSSAAPSRADIYRWEDGQGTVHFTDDVTSIPSQYRKGSSLLIREAPSSISPTPVSPPPGRPQATQPGSVHGAVNPDREEIASQVEHQRAKIAAKEQHIRAVDAKRSLAVNPLRNRIVDPADMELYNKYQEELPGDKEQLKELESLLDSIK